MTIKRRYRNAVLLLGLLSSATLGFGHWNDLKSAGELTFKSSDADVTKAFEWASTQARAYAFSGDPVGDWYEAALPGRQAFCMRDVAHQVLGAHALGLDRHNHNMLHRFAENISDSRDWCSYWEIDRYNRPSPADYKNDGEFWYCLPANYDILEACYRMFVWTGDYSYIKDPVFLNFYERSVTSYEDRWSLDPGRIMQRNRQMNVRGEFDPHKNFQVFRGNPSYDEGKQDTALGIDLLATQFAGYLAYAGIEDARNNEEAAETYREKAAAVRALVNREWWNKSAGQFYSRLNNNHQLDGKAGDSLLYRNVVEDGPKLKAVLNDLLNQISSHPSSSVEVDIASGRNPLQLWSRRCGFGSDTRSSPRESRTPRVSRSVFLDCRRHRFRFDGRSPERRWLLRKRLDRIRSTP